MIKALRSAGRVAWRAFLRFQEHHGPDRAAAVAYYTLLSLLPLLIFLFSIGGVVMGSRERAYDTSLLLIRGVVVHLSPAALEALRSLVEHASRFQWPGLVLLAWTARRMFAALFSALELVFGSPGRHFARHHIIAFSMVLVTGIAVLLTMVATTVLATFEGLLLRFRASGELEGLGFLFSILLPSTVTFSFLFVVYRLVPRRVSTARYAALGALLATVLWELAKAAFAYYVRHVARYSGVYGTLEGIIVLALWLELSVSIILYCGEVVALLLHQKTAAQTASLMAVVSH